jgi:hypothetical protein
MGINYSLGDSADHMRKFGGGGAVNLIKGMFVSVYNLARLYNLNGYQIIQLII